jgi:hypothetical protein
VPLRRRDYRWPMIAAAAAVVLMVAFVAWRLARRKARPLAPAVAFVAPAAPRVKLTGPAERALAALEALAQAGTLVADPRVGYDELVGIMRRFAHEQYGVAILDRTTVELLRSLGRQMAAPTLTLATTWFARCDLVKYAAERPAADTSDRDLAGARAVILAAVAPPAAAAAAARRGEVAGG